MLATNNDTAPATRRRPHRDARRLYILGVLLLGLIANALNLLSITGNLQYVIQGMVIIVAVMAQRGSR